MHLTLLLHCAVRQQPSQATRRRQDKWQHTIRLVRFVSERCIECLGIALLLRFGTSFAKNSKAAGGGDRDGFALVRRVVSPRGRASGPECSLDLWRINDASMVFYCRASKYRHKISGAPCGRGRIAANVAKLPGESQ